MGPGRGDEVVGGPGPPSAPLVVGRPTRLSPRMTTDAPDSPRGALLRLFGRDRASAGLPSPGVEVLSVRMSVGRPHRALDRDAERPDLRPQAAASDAQDLRRLELV